MGCLLVTNPLVAHRHCHVLQLKVQCLDHDLQSVHTAVIVVSSPFSPTPCYGDCYLTDLSMYLAFIWDLLPLPCAGHEAAVP
jgi:hypothetical protein